MQLLEVFMYIPCWAWLNLGSMVDFIFLRSYYKLPMKAHLQHLLLAVYSNAFWLII